MWVWSFWFPAFKSLALKNLQLLQSQDTELSPFPCPFTCPYTLHYPLFFLTLHQVILVTQNILFFDHDVHVPYNTTLMTPEIACLMENQQPLHALDGLLLVTLSPSEAQKPFFHPLTPLPDSLLYDSHGPSHPTKRPCSSSKACWKKSQTLKRKIKSRPKRSCILRTKIKSRHRRSQISRTK